MILFSISQFATRLFDANTLNQLIITSLQDSSPEVVFMMIKACGSILVTSILTKTSSMLIPSIQCLIKIIPYLISQNEEEYCNIILSSFGELITVRAIPAEMFFELFELCISVVSLIRSFDHSIIRSFDHSIIRSFDHSIIRSFDHSLFLSSSLPLFISSLYLRQGFHMKWSRRPVPFSSYSSTSTL